MPRLSLFSDVWRSVVGCYTSRVPPAPTQHGSQDSTGKTLLLGSAAFFSYSAGVKIALGGSDLLSDYSLFPKICLLPSLIVESAVLLGYSERY